MIIIYSLSLWQGKKYQQTVVSIHGPLGYGPSTLPLRQSASAQQGNAYYYERMLADAIVTVAVFDFG